MEGLVPMQRLVQGDVGSGKTAVAALALAKIVENGYQGALMVPTEVLAGQHYETFQQFYKGLPIPRPHHRQRGLPRPGPGGDG